MTATVLITGASTGIGAACARRFAATGLHVYAGVRREQDGEALRAGADGEIVPLRLDITDADQVAAAVATVRAAGGLDALVNNAGIAVAGPLEFVPVAELRRQLEINVVGHVQVTQRFLPLLRESHGRIVMVSSVGGRFSQPFLGPYCASKFALEAISDALRLELRPWGIQVAIVEPGAVRTPIWRKSAGAAAAMQSGLPPALHELYGRGLAVTRSFAKRAERDGVAAEAVAAVVERAVTAPRPRPRYRVGRDALLLTALARMPDRLRDELILRATGLPR